MIYHAIRRFAAIVVCCLVTITGSLNAQAADTVAEIKNPGKKAPKPFRILTEGSRITIQSKQDIDRVMVWTPRGHRYIEQTNINAPSYNFTMPSKEKFVFLMVQLKNGKHYTEKIGAQ